MKSFYIRYSKIPVEFESNLYYYTQDESGLFQQRYTSSGYSVSIHFEVLFEFSLNNIGYHHVLELLLELAKNDRNLAMLNLRYKEWCRIPMTAREILLHDNRLSVVQIS